MERLLRKLRRIRIVFRRSSRLTKTVVLATAALSLVVLLTLSISLGITRQSNRELAEQAAKLAQENRELREKVDAIGTAEGLKQYAMEKWGLVDPDTVVIEPTPTDPTEE